MNRMRVLLVSFIALALVLLITGTAVAAEVVGQEIYRVPADTVIEDDLYVSATEIYIEGTVAGDLIAAGPYLEINGTVEGDVLFVGLGLLTTGTVEGDMRTAAGGVELTGQVVEDVVAFSWGNASLPLPLGIPNGDLSPGIVFQAESIVGQDVLASSGSASFAGTIENNLTADGTSIQLTGRVGGDANISATLVEIGNTARVGGVLTYAAPQSLSIPAEVAAEVTYQPLADENSTIQQDLITMLLQVVSTLTGFALVGWAMLRWFPRALAQPVQVLFDYPVRSAWIGFLVGMIFLIFPVATFLLAAAVGLFWGLWPALVVAGFIVAALLLLWIFSPLITGMWLGLRFTRQPLNALLMGVLAIVLLSGLPLLGVFISYFSFCLTLGSVLLVWLTNPALPSAE